MVDFFDSSCVIDRCSVRRLGVAGDQACRSSCDTPAARQRDTIWSEVHRNRTQYLE